MSQSVSACILDGGWERGQVQDETGCDHIPSVEFLTIFCFRLVCEENRWTECIVLSVSVGVTADQPSEKGDLITHKSYQPHQHTEYTDGLPSTQETNRLLNFVSPSLSLSLSPASAPALSLLLANRNLGTRESRVKMPVSESCPHPSIQH